MGSKADKRYANSPKLERGDDGKMKVTKSEKKATEDTASVEGSDRGAMSGDMDMAARHAMERREMHNRHETEHAMAKSGDKADMHGRHQSDMKAMHKKHEKEMKSGMSGGDKLIDRTEVDGEE